MRSFYTLFDYDNKQVGFAAVNSSSWGAIWDWIFYGVLIAIAGAGLVGLGLYGFKKCKDRRQGQSMSGTVSESARQQRYMEMQGQVGQRLEEVKFSIDDEDSI